MTQQEKVARCFIIAEAGINHNGSLSCALDMIDCAKDCGADAVKFQCFDPEKFPPQQRAMLRPLTFTILEWSNLFVKCQNIGIQFMCTPFCVETARFMDAYVRRWKVSSQSVKNGALLTYIASTGKPVIMSNGMASDDDIETARHMIGHDCTILYCVSKYPTPDQDIHLSEITRMQALFVGACIGYSSHSRTFWDCVAAAKMGATVVEKHFTLDRSMPGPDQSSSSEPDELKAMVREIRACAS